MCCRRCAASTHDMNTTNTFQIESGDERGSDYGDLRNGLE